MGLDISAYSKIKKVDCVFDEDGEPIDTISRERIYYQFRAYVNPDFDGRADDVTNGSVYTYEGDDYHFCAGSYSGYGQWREELARLAGYESKPVDRWGTGNIQNLHSYGAFESTSGPFWETICFSDCEGIIGAEVSAKLAKDFSDFDEKAKTHLAESRFYDKYQQWRKAFELASDSGCVVFC